MTRSAIVSLAGSHTSSWSQIATRSDWQRASTDMKLHSQPSRGSLRCKRPGNGAVLAKSVTIWHV